MSDAFLKRNPERPQDLNALGIRGYTPCAETFMFSIQLVSKNLLTIVIIVIFLERILPRVM